MTEIKPDATRASRTYLVVGVLVWLGALALYVSTAAPGIVELFDDSLEFQLVAPAFGIAHPTGYPLYTIMGGVWSRLLFPMGNWAWRMNVFSAVAGATAVLLVYLLGAMLAPQGRYSRDLWAGLTASAAFALGPIWWGQTTIAEVYALHGLLMAAILYTAITIPPAYTYPSSSGAELSSRRMTLLAFLIGLSLAHHRMTMLLLPGLAVFLLWSVPGLWRPRAAWWMWIAALLLPLAMYAWLPLRASQGVADLNGSYENTLGGFLNHVLARGYAGFLGGDLLGARHTVADAMSLIVAQLGLVTAVLAGVGLLLMPLHRGRTRQVWTLLVLVLLCNLAFAVWYQVADWAVFFLPVLLILALYAGAGVSILSTGVSGIAGDPRLATAAGAILSIIVIGGFVIRGEFIDRSDEWDAFRYVTYLGTVPFPPHSCVVGLEGEMTGLKYIQAAEGQALAATPVTADRDDARAAAIEQCISDRVPTYVTRELAGIEESYSFSGEGPLVRVWPRGSSEVSPLEMPLDAELMNGRLRLQDYTTRILSLPGGPALELTLGWLPAEPLDRDIKVSLRMVDAAGEPMVYETGEPAIQDRYPLRKVALSHTWLPGELIHDVHLLPLRGLKEADSVSVIVYDAETVEELGHYRLPIE